MCTILLKEEEENDEEFYNNTRLMYVLKMIHQCESILKTFEQFTKSFRLITRSRHFSACVARNGRRHRARKQNSFPFRRVVINSFTIPICDAIYILVRFVRYLVQFLTIFDNRWRFVLVLDRNRQ